MILNVPSVERVVPSAGLKVQLAVTSFVKAPAVVVTTIPVRSRTSSGLYAVLVGGVVIDIAVTAVGTVAPQGDLITLNAGYTARVSEINVKEGDYVNKGDKKI